MRALTEAGRPTADGHRARWPRGDGGASALELTLFAPGLLVVIFFSIQAGLYFYGRAVDEQAAR